MLAPTLRTTCALIALSPLAIAQSKPPVLVYVLAGQSNMEGKAQNKLLEVQATDAKTRATFEHLRRDDQWIVRDDVFIEFRGRRGGLTMGYGSRGRTGAELELGTVLGDDHENPVLLVKAAWGGHSLFRQFRPPSAGLPDEAALTAELETAVQRTARRNEKHERKEPLPTMAGIREVYGSSYRAMLSEVRNAIAERNERWPTLAGRDVVIAGLFWFQGWNDQYGGAEREYAANLGHLIRDVRRDLSVPDLPVVIAVMGQNGSKPAKGAMKVIQEAQLSVPRQREFRSSVRAVRTDVLIDKVAEATYPTWKQNREAWDRVGSDHPYHYLGSAIWYGRIGAAMAGSMLELRRAAASRR